MARIGIISHTSRIIDIAREISSEIEHELIVRIGIPNKEVVEKAQRMENIQQVSAIIAPGAIYETIRDQVDVPVLRLELTNFELLKALHQAFKLGKKVVFVDFKRDVTQIYDPELVERIFEYDIERITINDPSEVETTVKTIIEKQYDVVISAAQCILDRTAPFLHSIELTYCKADLAAAVAQAIHTIEIGHKEKEKLRWMQTVVESFQEGMLTCDKEGTIETFNAAAEEITGLESEHLVGKNIYDLLKNDMICAIYGNGSSTTDEMITLDMGKLVINRIPIHIGPEQRGLVIKIQKVTKIQALEQAIRKGLLKKGFVAKTTFADIAGKSVMIRDLKETAQKYATSCSNILITGDSGTGKELFAQSIHNSSSYRKGPFVAVNCAALSESLLESELFGYEEGAFTGAKKGGKEGLFELAHNGTIFLDEIGDMPISLQSRLLRVLQEKEVIRLGGNQMIPVNNRIVCATNKNLPQEIEKGSFRKDLFYRINILQIHIPPLRERQDDIPVIGSMIFRKKCKERHKNLEIQSELFQMMKRYQWPGNVREIEAFVERLLAVTEGPAVEHANFMKCLNSIESTAVSANNLKSYVPLEFLEEGKVLLNLGTMTDMENEIIQQVFNHVDGDKDRVEKTLGISKTTLWRRMKSIGYSC
jgi:transcriptional regulator with PAS, ATPase and Fis domain